MSAMAASEAADQLALKLLVPTGQKTIESDELIPCFSIPCLGMYYSPNDKCGCFSANNQICCCSAKCKKTIKLCKCGKEGQTGYIKLLFLKFVVKKPEPKVGVAAEGWNPKNRDLLKVKVDIGTAELEINLDVGGGFYQPGCSKCFFGCKTQNKCCCCVQQGALPFDSHQACACFGLACLPGVGCCKTVGTLIGKKAEKKLKNTTLEEKNSEMEMKSASPKSSKKKKDENKVKVKAEGGAGGMMSEL